MRNINSGWVLAVMLLLSACGGEDDRATAFKPRDLTREETCMIDGMILLDYPGPKGQLFYKNGEAYFFCDTKGLIETLFNPDYRAKIKQAYVQDVGGREWGSYADRWVEIEKSFLVMDGSKLGAMGPTIATFGTRADADAFAQENGGTVLPFTELSEELFADYQRRVRQYLRELTELKPISGDGSAAEEMPHQHD
jgi:copper chaperone NosL